jgi:hypothetical protein
MLREGFRLISARIILNSKTVDALFNGFAPKTSRRLSKSQFGDVMLESATL